MEPLKAAASLSRFGAHLTHLSHPPNSLDIYASPAVDTRELMRAAKVGTDDTPLSIHDKVDAVRKRLYPDEPILLSVGPRVKNRVANAASLIRAIYWWNNTNCGGCYWYAYYNSTTAVMVTDDVIGTYYVYDVVGSGSWVKRYTVRTGGAATRYSTGSYTRRGFRGTAVGSARADVVMYFFY